MRVAFLAKHASTVTSLQYNQVPRFTVSHYTKLGYYLVKTTVPVDLPTRFTVITLA